MYNQYYYPNYLMHHGVKGMRWGVRRTPEKFSNGYRRAKSSFGSATNKAISTKEKVKNFKLTDQQKRTAKKVAIGAAVVAGVGLATYGGIKVGKLHSARMNNMAAVETFIRKNNVKLGGPYKGPSPGEISEATITNTKIGPYLNLKSTIYKDNGYFETSRGAGADAINRFAGLHYKKDTNALAKAYKARIKEFNKGMKVTKQVRQQALNDANAPWSPYPEVFGKRYQFSRSVPKKATSGISNMRTYRKYKYI